MAARRSEADELATRRRLFERAQRDGVPMDEAKRRIAAERWAAMDRRLGAKIAAVADARRDDEEARPRPWMMHD